MTLTREETIERLKQNKAAAEYYAGQSQITAEIENALKDSEAFDMAIEALTEPINCVKCKHYYETEDDTDVHGHCRMDTAHTNLISRADALRELNGACSNWKDDCKVAEIINALPSADAEWIKVTEDTPPEYPCLVCDANGNQPFVPMGIVTITDEEHGEWHIDGRLWDSPKVFVDGEWGNQISYGNRIIAWMPLPKPYREESEVEE